MKNNYTLLIILMLLINFNGYAQIISASFGNAQTGPVPNGTTNAPIVKIKIVTGASPTNFESMTFNIANSTNFVTDVSSAKLYATDTNSVFATSYPYFTPNLMVGVVQINPSLSLSAGDNYFWLAYDIRPTAVAGHCVGALIDSLFFNGNVVISPVSNLNFDDCIKIGNPTLSINDPLVPSTTISLFPNPANDFISINNLSLIENNFDLQISDVFGKLVLQQQAVNTAQGATISISALNSGVYFAEIKTANKTYYQRFIKK